MVPGEHFLSIRPWEPNFKAEMANVLSIAVWIRFNGLLIEYYEAQVLKEIGDAVGKFFRIDTHTHTQSQKPGDVLRGFMCILMWTNLSSQQS